MSVSPEVNAPPDSVEDAGALAGAPDAFRRLWTPHRMAYIAGESKPATARRTRVPVLPCPAADRTPPA